MLERTSTTERYARSIIAAVVAVAALVLAANAGPARALEQGPDRQADQVRHVEHVQRS
ncbi:hypothetical protein [Streptomyces sp. S.PB5]|uniref:hypothetical protein n=1 Tax=Streptomyces sp. S.PB5 TaxID=3020844 RepID=UPI0025B1C997|nr:hypothetical protein [Streptomyces sp. S.PB5]MDN3023576.1 hypothetical protein [Streptomyces sp. S.PB5]